MVIDNQHDEETQNENIPSMVLSIDTVPPEVSPILPHEVPVPNDTNPEEEELPPNEQMEDLSSRNTEKKSRLEQGLMSYENQAPVKLHDEFN